MKHANVTWIVRVTCLLLVLALAGLRFGRRRTELSEFGSVRQAGAERAQTALPSSAASSTVASSNRIVAFAQVARKLLPSQDQLWDQPVPEPEFARFAEWVKKYRAAGVIEQAALEAEGIQLARVRRAALRRLIKSDPARALALALPAGVRGTLPEAVVRLLESKLSGRGSLDVLAALAEPGKESEVTPTFRTATIDGREYEAFVYGRRLGEPTRPDAVMNGVVVDNLFAVNENPLRLLEPEEAAQLTPVTSEPLCAVSGNSWTINRSQIAAEAGGQPVFLCGPAHAEKLNEQLIQAEVAGDTGGGGGEVLASPHTEGIKRLLLIRVDFSDLAGEPLSESAGISLMSGLDAFYTESSYGRTGFAPAGAGSEITPTLRMPQLATYYGQNDFYAQLRADARNAAVTAGYVLSDYDYDLICFGPVPGWGWAGLGYVGAAGAWLRNYFTTGVAGHELGHNYGLNHANSWDTGGQSVIGTGSSVEYGDINDTMGTANAGASHFNARSKSYLNWLTPSDTLTVSTSGVYRIYPQDDANSTGLRGLKIVRSSTTNYWVEFRQRFTENPWLMNGAGLRWAGNGNEKSLLLDTTPGSPDGKNDAALVLGRTFSDQSAGIHITTLRKGGTIPESLDVAVKLGTFPGNVAPAVTVSADATVTTPGSTLTFSAAASDADGDTLAYAWDLGDGTFGTNGSAASKSWTSDGEYVVRCEVSDMKGGVGSGSVIVTVGHPGTYRITGRVTAGGGGVEGVRVSVSSMKMTYTDSAGTYALVGLPPGSYSVRAELDGYNFSALDFANPVNVGPDATGIDFHSGGASGLPVAPAITGQPQSQAVGAGGNVTFSVAVSGSTPLWYQWRYNGGELGGANDPALALLDLQPQEAGGYSVVVTNAGGAVTSAVATLTVNCNNSLSAGSAAFGALGGSGSVDVTAHAGCAWSVASVPAWVTITAGLGGSGNGTVDYNVAGNPAGFTRSAILSIGGRNYTVSQSAADLTRPTVSMTAPGANVSFTNAAITVSGTADDDSGLARVEFRVGSDQFVPASGTTAWTAPVTLSPGSNVVSVRSVDFSGNISLTNTRSFFCAVPATLSLAINGLGSVKGGTNGQRLEIGRAYQLTAEPAPGCVFSNWTGGLAGVSPSIAFVMQSNLAVTANFVTNPFVRANGAFSGLFYETDEVRLGHSGFFTFKLTDRGRYSASLLIGRKKSVASGRLDLQGTATNLITRSGTNALRVTWMVDLSGAHQITGTISDGNWTAQLLGDRAVFSATRPAPPAGAYTLILPGAPGSTSVPEGASYGTATVNAKGMVVLKGSLPDRSSIAVRAALSEAGHWPVYASLYGGKGALLGWAGFADRPASDFDGVISWIKSPQPLATYYPDGFSREAVLTGSHYTPPAGVTNRILNLTNGLVVFSGGNLPHSLTNAVLLGSANRITNAGPNSLAMTFRLSSGLFRGSLIPAGNTKAISFNGAVLQKAGLGSGYFLGTNQSGRVSIEPAP